MPAHSAGRPGLAVRLATTAGVAAARSRRRPHSVDEGPPRPRWLPPGPPSAREPRHTTSPRPVRREPLVRRADLRGDRPLASSPSSRAPFRAVGRTVRPQPAREAWSTGAEVAGAPWQTRRPPPRRARSGRGVGKRISHPTPPTSSRSTASFMNYTLVFPAESFGGPDRRAARQQVTVRQPEHDRHCAFAPRASYPQPASNLSRAGLVLDRRDKRQLANGVDAALRTGMLSSLPTSHDSSGWVQLPHQQQEVHNAKTTPQPDEDALGQRVINSEPDKLQLPPQDRPASAKVG